MSANNVNVLEKIAKEQCRTDIPDFRTGDTVQVHSKIVEGAKERIQVFEGVVIKRSKSDSNPSATFTVRKISYNVGVERTFLLHSPRIDKIKVVRQGAVRRSRLFYLRPLRGKATRIKGKYRAALKDAVFLMIFETPIDSWDEILADFGLLLDYMVVLDIR